MILDPYYVGARRVLLDALEDLAEHRDAIVVVGAQAVYLRTGAANVGVAEYTTDGDLAVAERPPRGSPASRRRDERSLRPRSTRADRTRGTGGVDTNGRDRRREHRHSDRSHRAGGHRAAGRITRRASGPHGKRAARKAPGLEAAIIDNDIIPIAALDAQDRRTIPSKVAGPTALLIAKAHKINDRLAQEARPDRLIDKDASDVYRLMLTAAPERINEVVPSLLEDPRVAGPTQRGLELLRAQFGARRAPVWRWPSVHYASASPKIASGPSASPSSPRSRRTPAKPVARQRRVIALSAERVKATRCGPVNGVVRGDGDRPESLSRRRSPTMRPTSRARHRRLVCSWDCRRHSGTSLCRILRSRAGQQPGRDLLDGAPK